MTRNNALPRNGTDYRGLKHEPDNPLTMKIKEDEDYESNHSKIGMIENSKPDQTFNLNYPFSHIWSKESIHNQLRRPMDIFNATMVQTNLSHADIVITSPKCASSRLTQP